MYGYIHHEKINKNKLYVVNKIKKINRLVAHLSKRLHKLFC